MPFQHPAAKSRLRGFCLLAAFSLVLVACARTSDETRIRDAIAGMQAALEERRPADFMAFVAEDFTGADGTFDREALHKLLRAQVLANASIGITSGPLDIEMQGDRASVRMTTTFTGGNARWLPERGSVYTLTSGWRRSGDTWLCFNAQWERVL